MQHPPYPVTAYLGAAWWIICFTSAFILAVVSDWRWRFLPCILIAFLFFTHFLLPRIAFLHSISWLSLPTELVYAELPVQIALCFYAVVGLLGFQSKRGAKRDIAVAS